MTNPITALLIYLRDFRDRLALAKARANSPATLEEALDRIIAHSSPEDLREFASTIRDKAGTGLHFGLGMWMRNSWGLWENKTSLARELGAAGILHGDDRSGAVFTALWCRLNHQPFSLKEEAAKYAAYWRAYGCNPDGSPLHEKKRYNGSDCNTLWPGDDRWY